MKRDFAGLEIFQMQLEKNIMLLKKAQKKIQLLVRQVRVERGRDLYLLRSLYILETKIYTSGHIGKSMRNSLDMISKINHPNFPLEELIFDCE